MPLERSNRLSQHHGWADCAFAADRAPMAAMMSTAGREEPEHRNLGVGSVVSPPVHRPDQALSLTEWGLIAYPLA